MATSAEDASDNSPGTVRLSEGSEYEIAVAISPPILLPQYPSYRVESSAVPGFEETMARGAHAERRPSLVEKGEEAVRAATEAIAGQIGRAAERIATTIAAETSLESGSSGLGLESVEVTFGVTLSAGLQTMFTALVDSSAQVTVTLNRQMNQS